MKLKSLKNLAQAIELLELEERYDKLVDETPLVMLQYTPEIYSLASKIVELREVFSEQLKTSSSPLAGSRNLGS